MKSIIRLSLFSLFLLLFECMEGHSQETSATVTFSNLGSKPGKLYIGWYNNADDFRKPGKAVAEKIVDASGDEVSVTFDGLKKGTYAIAVFYDVNGNGKMDTNMLGIPKERYGFSNNVYPAMRAARFDEAKFELDGSKIGIRLK